MSDPGRDDVWTDLEGLLRRAETGKEPASTFADEAGQGVELRPGDTGQQDSGDSSLPFEDLLSELLGSWSDETATSIESAPDCGEPVEVPLSTLMARLMEDPQPPDSDLTAEWSPSPEHSLESENAIASLGALRESLSVTPSIGEVESSPEPLECESPAVDEDGSSDHVAAPQFEESPAQIEAQPVQPEESAVSDEGMTPEALPIVDRLDEVVAESPTADEVAELLEPHGAEIETLPGPAISWTDDLFNALVSADEGQVPQVTSDEEVDAVEAEPLGVRAKEDEFSSGWEMLASLPAPSPPSFSETMLFEPPLPPDSLFNWPVAQQGQGAADPGYEAVTFEEAEAGPEVESDDSLRRLVGQMLAEMAAAAAPTQRTPSMDAAVERATERFLSFSLAGEVYAVALAGILETDRLPRVTRVPGLPAWAIGVSNLRGAILPVVDLRRLLSLEEAENPQDGRILVVRPSPSEPPAVLVVDRLEGVALLAPNELHPAPVWLDSKILPYLEGIGSFKGRLVNVLDLGRLFNATGVTGDETLRVGEIM